MITLFLGEEKARENEISVFIMDSGKETILANIMLKRYCDKESITFGRKHFPSRVKQNKNLLY
jgi:2-hydroxy-3-keto-5-methylthiopentenyl-1-phosphate phosphatase